MIDIIFGYAMLALFVFAVLLTILSGPIAEWLNAREDRKKAAADAKAAGAVASPAAAPSTVASSAPSSTPEPA
ncbi:MAG: hypothetical protein OXU71_10565 [Gammaproteobacteria bacterium]|nr:hypothetical protein [Gammaproteobacteria bacterium]